ncbi:hypothetical protein BASA61_010372 [Batrachochytrium salamandrivorans]|nr:hypothetical protein BASA61_010372 [Batrachochytrium salamandrivorans]KAH6584895.1 hypothetical protein BASA60_000772 [Batrachochytrium salamandrivorans]KAH9250051.1 hypothetical protein BASA81_012184 [Batrachochytrium salamandrivorans]
MQHALLVDGSAIITNTASVPYTKDTIASEAASLGGSTVPSDRVSVSASAKSVLPIPETVNAAALDIPVTGRSIDPGSIASTSLLSSSINSTISSSSLSASDIHTEASLRPDSLHTQQRTPVTTTTLGRRDKIRKNRQSQLLLVSLLENFCMMYDESGDRNRKLFYVLCRQLSNMGMIDSSDFIEELSTVRESYKRAFKELVVQAMEAVQSTEKRQRMLAYRGFEFPLENRDALPTSQYVESSSVPLIDLDGDMPSSRLWMAHDSLHTDSLPLDFSEYFNLKTSRYLDDFEELDCLGRGAFGKVHCCRNRLDGRKYAVKKIRMANANSYNIEKVLREVKWLARVTDTHVVRYYSSWLEHVPIVSRCSAESSDISDESTSEEDTSSVESPSLNPSSNDSEILFHADDSQRTDSSIVPRKMVSSAADYRRKQKLPVLQTNDPSMVAVRNARDSLYIRDTIACELTLFIQMELCEYTLYDWLSTHNDTASDVISFERKQGAIHCFRNILSALACMHSQGIIHRDVKPRNIYWKACSDNTGGGDWKLGDFGLATVFDLRAETTSNDGSIVSQASDKRDRRDKHAKHMDRTIGVGTITYASPEQLDPQRYDTVYSPLSDIFSLGIILFELLCVFRTGMERATLIGNLRNGILPKTFVKRYPKEATLILCMTAEDPRKRPLAQFLLEDLELFNVQDTASEVNPHKVTPAIMQPGIVNAREHSSHQHESTDPDRQLFRVRDCAIQTMYQHGCQRCEEMSVEMDRLKCRIVELEKRLGSCASSM